MTKPKLPSDTNLLREMTDYLPVLYFPKSTDDDTIHTIARNEFSRAQDLIRRKYDTDEGSGNSNSPFDTIENDFEQAVYARMRFDSKVTRLDAIRKETIKLIREAVEKEGNIVGTFYCNKGVHFRHDDENEEEYDDAPVVVIHNTAYGSYGGFEGNTVYELFIDTDGELLCTLNGEAGETFDELIEHVQVEGLLEIAHWLETYGFIDPDVPERKFNAPQQLENQKIQFEIANVDRAAIGRNGYRSDNLSDEDMAEIAEKMGDYYYGSEKYNIDLQDACNELGMEKIACCPRCENDFVIFEIGLNANLCNSCGQKWDDSYTLVEEPDETDRLPDDLGYPSREARNSNARYIPTYDYIRIFKKGPEPNSYFQPVRFPESKQYMPCENYNGDPAGDSIQSLNESILDEKGISDFGANAIWVPSCNFK